VTVEANVYPSDRGIPLLRMAQPGLVTKKHPTARTALQQVIIHHCPVGSSRMVWRRKHGLRTLAPGILNLLRIQYSNLKYPHPGRTNCSNHSQILFSGSIRSREVAQEIS
jgi:hypothetical protein